MLDLLTIDPATLQAGPELDALIAKWRGWKRDFSLSQTHSEYWRDGAGLCRPLDQWQPSTNPAHAGEARRKAKRSFVEWTEDVVRVSVGEPVGGMTRWHSAEVCCNANGDKGKAEALATCRAIVAAMQAAEQENQSDISDTM